MRNIYHNSTHKKTGRGSHILTFRALFFLFLWQTFVCICNPIIKFLTLFKFHYIIAHCGMKVLALSLITNMAAGMQDVITTAEVDETAEATAEKFQALMLEIVSRL